ncbi:hypothetical protein MARBORIA2_13750 [Methanobrevibacter arboriphilus]|uniref:Uncharacterized protein n=1 Tax=Methanobrevibacter arboriphilus TaxID=39441 RepID=A0ACA8R0U1_METAZ|nr:PIN domain-containing protein [Methanobrevibacter arboriphilus]BBL61120.1 hypothetical protein MarbSA_01600 [Methanobrevibacter arboriphilus]GLI12285.1 hypothetical protein MARBORIA2_13750 [Methanobrevibacter arboriphilus]
MIFIDASFIIGLMNKKDQWHDKALDLVDFCEKKEKFTSNLVITEILNSVGTYIGGKGGKLLYDNLKDNYTIYDENREIYDLAIYTFRHFNGNIGFADCVSIEIMKKHNINQIVSFDSDFDKIKGIKRIF